MGAKARAVAFWLAIVLLVGLSALGLQSAIGELDPGLTPGQQVATFTQFGYAIVGLVSAGALVRRHAWARGLLLVWAGLLTVTAALATVVWGGAGLTAALVSGGAGVAIALVVIWLATRERSRLGVGSPSGSNGT
jgi:hypothetical protein